MDNELLNSISKLLDEKLTPIYKEIETNREIRKISEVVAEKVTFLSSSKTKDKEME